MYLFEDIRHAIHSLAQRVRGFNSSSSPILSASHGLPAHDSRAICDVELDDLDCLILDLTVGLQEFRARAAAHRNTFSPAHSLPPEVLSNVFETYATIEESPRHLHPAFTLSWVCAYWRAVALDCSAIWSRFGLSATPFPVVELLLRRSREHPLRILRCATYVDEEILALMLGHLYRTKDLDMSIQQSSYAHDLVSGRISFDGPCLERVTLHFPRPSTMPGDAPPLHVLSNPLFDNKIRQLRHVVLDKGRVPWNTGYLRNLSTLKILQCPVGAVTIKDRDICLVIRDSPNLEVLDLSLYKNADWGSRTDRLIAPHAPGRRATLPSLHTLHLDVPVHYACHLLAHFDMISLKILTVNLGTIDEQDAPLANLLTQGLIPTHLVSSLESFEAWCLRDCSETGGFSGSSSNEEIYLSLQWEAASRDTDVRILHWMAESLCDYHDTRFMNLRLACDLSSANMRFCIILARRPTLACLRLVGRGAVSTISSMVDNWPDLTHIAVDSKLSCDEASAIVTWCHKQHSLTTLDLSKSSVPEHRVHQFTPFALCVRNLGFKVKADALETWSYDPGYVAIRTVIPSDMLVN